MSNSLYSKDYALLIQMLRELREVIGITQAELATRLGRTQAYVSKSERCERRLDVMELVQFCEALEIDPHDLIERFLARRRERQDKAAAADSAHAGSALGRSQPLRRK